MRLFIQNSFQLGFLFLPPKPSYGALYNIKESKRRCCRVQRLERDGPTPPWSSREHGPIQSMHKAPNHIYALPLRTQIDGLIKMSLFPSLMMLRANRTIPFSCFGYPSRLWIGVFGSHSNTVQPHMVQMHRTVLIFYVSSTLLYHSIPLPRILNYIA